MPDKNIVRIQDLKGLGVKNFSDWNAFQSENPNMILGELAFALLTKRM